MWLLRKALKYFDFWYIKQLKIWNVLEMAWQWREFRCFLTRPWEILYLCTSYVSNFGTPVDWQWWTAGCESVTHSYKVSVKITQTDTNKCPDCSCLITESPYSVINCTFPLEIKFFGKIYVMQNSCFTAIFIREN